ncbi:GDSL esterase/lipase At1g29670 [Linum perenne]
MGRPLNVHLSIILVVMVASAGEVSSRPPEVPCYFIFGDSLFDSGNNNNLQTLSKANYSPYGVGFPGGGPTGRFTDGRTIADILGELMGFQDFVPPFAAYPNRSELLVGVNYASGSAGILVKSGKQGGDNVDMKEQLRNHDLIVSYLVAILGSKKSAYRHLAKCLMYKLGARKVGLAGVSPIGCTPAAIARMGKTNDSQCDESMNQLVMTFNARLRSLVDELNGEFSDAKFMYLNSTRANQLAIQVSAAAGASSPPPEVPCYFIFGDSIFDSGNNNNLATSMKANYLPYGVDFPTGPIGVNYASASAGILFQSGKLSGDNMDMDRQLRNHGLTVSSIASILGSRKSAYDYLAKCLYISNVVNNEYVNNYLLPQSSYIRQLYNPDQFAALLIQTYYNQIKCLYNLGARKVGLAGVLPIGCTPSAIGPNGSVCVDSLNQLVAPFNTRLRALVDRLNVDFPDAKFVYLDSTSAFNLASQGLGVKTVSCCQARSTDGLCIPNSVPCPVSVRQSYLFWDALHPTEAANRVVAPAFYQAIKPVL